MFDEKTDEDRIFQELADDMSKMMAGLFLKYPGYEHLLAHALCDSLGGLIAIASKDPMGTVRSIARRLLKTPIASIRAEHFGYKLGVQEPQVKPASPGEVIHVGFAGVKRN